MKTIKSIISAGVLMTSMLMVGTMMLSCDTDPIDTPEDTTLSSFEGIYYGDAYGTGSTRLELSLENEGFRLHSAQPKSGTGVKIIIECFNTAYDFEHLELQTGKYIIDAGYRTNGTPVTFAPGRSDGDEICGSRVIFTGTEAGSRTSKTILITGGSVAISKADGRYTIETDFSGQDAATGTPLTKNIKYVYSGSVGRSNFMDKSTKPEPEYLKLNGFTGLYFGDDRGFGTASLGLNLHNGSYDPDSGTFSGDYDQLSLIAFNTMYKFDQLNFETGDYTVTDTLDGAPRSIVKGEANGASPKYSFYKTRSSAGGQAVDLTYIIVSGTLTAEKQGNIYTITAEFKGVDAASANGRKGVTETDLKFKYEGEVNSKFKDASQHEEDPYKEFKADETLRFLRQGEVPVYNRDGYYMFYRDSGTLFSSSNLKIGYGAPDGLAFYMIEWQGGTSEGPKSGASIRTQKGVTDLYSLSIVQYRNGAIWVVYKASPEAPEEFAVQEWL